MEGQKGLSSLKTGQSCLNRTRIKHKSYKDIEDQTRDDPSFKIKGGLVH